MEKSTGSGLEGAREKERGQSLGKTRPGDLVGRGEERPDRDKGGNPEAQAGPELKGPGEKNREAPVLGGPARRGASPEACLTGVWPGALGSCCLGDRVRPAEAHELCAAPQRLSQRSGLLAEAPLALPEARQAQHSQGPPRSHAAEPPEAGLPWAEVEPGRGGARAGNTQGAGTRRGRGFRDKTVGRGRKYLRPAVSQGAGGAVVCSAQRQPSQAWAGDGPLDPGCT